MFMRFNTSKFVSFNPDYETQARSTQMWQNRIRPNKTTEVPYAYTPSEDDPLVLVPDPNNGKVGGKGDERCRCQPQQRPVVSSANGENWLENHSLLATNIWEIYFVV